MGLYERTVERSIRLFAGTGRPCAGTGPAGGDLPALWLDLSLVKGPFARRSPVRKRLHYWVSKPTRPASRLRSGRPTDGARNQTSDPQQAAPTNPVVCPDVFSGVGLDKLHTSYPWFIRLCCAHDHFNILPLFFGDSLLTSGFVVNYGQLMFGWESLYFDGHLARPVQFRHLLWAKLLLMQISCPVLALVCLPFLLIFASELLVTYSVFLLYNIGFSSACMLFLRHHEPQTPLYLPFLIF